MDVGALEEERRLAYVAITRARRRAIILNAMQRLMFGERKYNSPSRFITEMDGQFLDFQGGAARRAYRDVDRSYSKPRPPRPENTITSPVGKLVEHAELGRGTVIAQNGDTLTIAFGSRGIKNVMKNFVTFI